MTHPAAEDAGVRHQLALVNICCRLLVIAHIGDSRPTSGNLPHWPPKTHVVRCCDNFLYYFKGARGAPCASGA